MRAGRLHARLDQLTWSSTTLGRIVVISPDDWSTAGQLAYDAACLAGDTETQAAIIAQETGEAVDLTDGSVIKLIEIRESGDGPG